MPNRYEREIEEILRNMEETEPRQRLGDRIRAFNRKPARGRTPRLHMSRTEVLFIIGIVLALAGAALAFYQNQASLISGAIVTLAFVVLLLGLGLEFRDRFRGYRSPSPWRANVIDITPRRRRNPFSAVATRVRIFRLKLRYWRNRKSDNLP